MKIYGFCENKCKHDVNEIKEVNYNDYVEFNSDVETKLCQAYKVGNVVYINYDIVFNYTEGETKLGTIKKPLLTSSLGSARTSIGNDTTKLRPATILATSNGDFKIYSNVEGTLTCGTITLLIDED